MMEPPLPQPSQKGSGDQNNDWMEYLKKTKKVFLENFNKKTVGPNLSISDFEMYRTLGTGSFGRVIQAKYNTNHQYYAIKVMDKGKILKTKQLDHTLNEKKVLQSISFPFLVNMQLFFKDNSYLYFVMPFVIGGEMFTHLRKMGKFDENLTRFYASQVVLGLEYLHYLDLIYRDLKPENILIDKTGYLKITDFGFCKIVKGRTYTLCGTPEYLAPEIILNKGYEFSVDWWSFGILIYEMSAGYPPFNATDQMTIYEKIVSGKYRVPEHFSTDSRDILKNLIQTDTTKRYGHLKDGVNDIKVHKFFRSINWLSVLNQKLEAPFIPTVKNAGDSRNFDSYDEEPLKIASKEEYIKEFKSF